MKKTSKILSLLVALCMAVTMLSGLTVFAEDALQLVSFDADADFITLDFNKAIDTTNSTIVLKKGDEFVPFTLAKPLHHSNVQSKAASRYTYTLTPDGGVEVGEEYKITLWDVKASETDVLAQTAYTFVVEELATTANFQNVDGYKWTEVEDWNWEMAEDGSKFYIDEMKTPSKNNMEGFAQVGAKIGNDDTEEHVLPSKSNTTGSANWTESEYTVKATFKSDARLARPQIYFGIARNITGYNATSANNTDITGFNFGGYTNQAATQQTPNLYFINGGHVSGSAVKNLGGTNRVSTKIDMTAGVALKVSSKAGVVRMFINNKKAADFAATVAPGFPVFAFRPVGANDSATACDVELYDMQVTKSTFEEVTELDYPEGYEPPAPPEPEEPEEEEYPELIHGWDADLNVFTVDFTEEVQAFDATVTQAGAIIPATLSHAIYTGKTTGSYSTWTIKPDAGFTADIPYTVTISNVKNADASKKISTWSKTFKVEILAEGLDLTDGSVVTKANKPTTANATFTNDGDDVVLTTASAGADSSYIYIAKTLDSGEKEADYTINVTLKDFVNVGYTQGFIGIISSNLAANYNYDHASLKGVLHYAKLGANATSNACYSNIRRNLSGTNTQSGPGNFGTVKFRGTDPVPVQLKLSVKDGVATTYFNGKKTADQALEGTVTGAPQMMIHIRSIPDATATSSVTFADFVATRAVHADVLGDSFTAETPEVAEGAIAENSVINVSAVVTNNTAEAKTIFAMCALYDATGAMKNIVIAPVTQAASGETTIDFANVDTNGATYAKIFIWDDAETLNPWFPAITIE